MLRKTVRFIADVLQHSQAGVVSWKSEWFASRLHVYQLFFFREADDHRRFHVHRFENVHRRVQLTEPAVDENDVGIELVAGARFAISP